ncbi:MAG: MMPL family transporter [Thermoleophilaceae bacterium]|nr:MMPL family transporter [Thermoleophilaceae bacterium]
MTGPLYRIGRACARHHWPVVAAWLLAAVALVAVAQAAGSQNSDNLSLNGTDSKRAQDLLSRDLPDQAYGTNPIVLRSTDGKLSDSKNKQAIDAAVKSLRSTDHVIKAVSPFSSEGKGALTKNERIGYISVTLDVGASDLSEDEAQDIIDAADPAKDAGIEVSAGGYLGSAVSKADEGNSELIGIAAAVIILLFAFGTVTAMVLPIVTALIGVAASLSIISLLGHVAEVPDVSSTLATMIGLGVGIDYALFIVTRHKLQMKDGMEIRESIARSTATAGGAVVFAGGTVIIALVSLLASGIPLVGTMGYCAAVGVVVAVLAATTLLPALLGALGHRIDSLRVKLGSTHPDDHQPHGWARWARFVGARPWSSMIVGTVILLVLAAPVLNLEFGSSDAGELPDSTTARQAFDNISEGFGSGANAPLLVSAKLDPAAKPDQSQLDKIDDQQRQLEQQQQAQEQQLVEEGVPQAQAQQQVQQQTASQQQKLDQQKKLAESPATDTRLTGLENAIKKTDGIKSVSPASVDKKGTAAVFTAVPTTPPSDQATEDLVNHLRDDVIPKETRGKGITAYVGGQTAGYIDLARRISEKLPQIILIVVGLSFLVLLLAFRAILVPLKAAVANLLSVAAAYGVVTFVFQEGHGAALLGLEGPTPIVSYVPLFMFAILFGLSMDYEVFLMTQIREHFEESGDARESVVQGLAQTGRVITSAALIMVCVFSSFILTDDAVIKQFGVGLSVAIAIDATVVRCLFVPAVMTLLGKAAWWLPGGLDKVLPEISVEGQAYFDALDRQRA